MVDIGKLVEPFSPNDIEWRVGSSGIIKAGARKGQVWAKCLAYITARAVEERLDDVFGTLGWQTAYRPGTYKDWNTKSKLWEEKTGFICRLSVFDEVSSDWVYKESAAQCTDFEAWKGGQSDSFKRVASHGFGIGRYLYRLPETFAQTQLDRGDGYHKAKVYDYGNKTDVWYYWYVGEEALPDFALPKKGVL